MTSHLTWTHGCDATMHADYALTTTERLLESLIMANSHLQHRLNSTQLNSTQLLRQASKQSVVCAQQRDVKCLWCHWI